MNQSRSTLTLISTLLCSIGAAWGYLFYQHIQMLDQPMSNLWMPPAAGLSWQPRDFYLVYLMWAIMMAAMMLPSAIPMILAYAKICHRQNRAALPSTFLFISAYLAIWCLFSGVLTVLQWQLHNAAWLSPMMENQNSLLAALLLFLAGLYQFLPLKHVCLTRCKTPMGFLLNEWQEGFKGAWVMGLKHGLNCVGCCWTQMLLMFAVGVMNLIGMAVLTLLMILEKCLPLQATLLARALGSIFIIWGVLILIA